MRRRGTGLQAAGRGRRGGLCSLRSRHSTSLAHAVIFSPIKRDGHDEYNTDTLITITIICFVGSLLRGISELVYGKSFLKVPGLNE